jgi:hypothetical protein
MSNPEPTNLTTYEEATRCPFGCAQPGRLQGSTRPMGPRGPKVETFECVNERCEQTGERWHVQINADGTIPPKGSGSQGPKQFDIDNHTTQRDRQNARDYMRMMEEQAVQGGRDV